MRVSVSRIGVFQQCPRRFYYEYIKERVPIRDTRPLVIGSAWHSALESLLKDGKEAAVNTLNSMAGELTEEEAAKLAALLSHYRFDSDRYDVVEAEHHFDIPTGIDGYTIQGFVDGLLRDKKTGELVCMEHKTTSESISGYSQYRKRLQVDLQISAYMLATGASYCVYDVVRKPALKLRKNESVNDYQSRLEERFEEQRDEHFQIWEIYRSYEELLQAREDIYGACSMIKHCVESKTYPRATKACKGHFGWCPFIDVCSGSADIGDETRFTDKEKR